MAWWDWLVIGAAISVVAVAALVWLIRRTRRGRAILKLTLREKLRFGRVLLSDRATPFPARVLLAVLVGYLLLPFDLIPDFVPVLGQLDDLLVVAVVLGLVLWLVDGERLDEAVAAARDPAEPRRTGQATGS
jgi:uncharacterized membrane protein YkvA (DUF1232 family)